MGGVGSGGSAEMQQRYASTMSSIPQLASLGPLFKSSKVLGLTELETEYVVTCVKHTMGAEFTVFQFNVTNTLPEIVLERVVAKMTITSTEDPLAAQLKPEFVLPIDRVACNETQTIYAVFRRPLGGAPVTANFGVSLGFVCKEIDPSTGEPEDEGYEDEYVLEDVDLVLGEYMLPIYVTEFMRKWEDLDPERQAGAAFESVETYALTAVPSIAAAITTLLNLLGMSPAEGTEQARERATAHQLLLSGVFVGGIPCLARCRMVWDPTNGVALELAVRSKNADVAERLANAVS
jgi:coatomer protein complex subunit gamma